MPSQRAGGRPQSEYDTGHRECRLGGRARRPLCVRLKPGARRRSGRRLGTGRLRAHPRSAISRHQSGRTVLVALICAAVMLPATWASQFLTAPSHDVDAVSDGPAAGSADDRLATTVRPARDSAE